MTVFKWEKTGSSWSCSIPQDPCFTVHDLLQVWPDGSWAIHIVPDLRVSNTSGTVTQAKLDAAYLYRLLKNAAALDKDSKT